MASAGDLGSWVSFSGGEMRGTRASLGVFSKASGGLLGGCGRGGGGGGGGCWMAEKEEGGKEEDEEDGAAML